MTDTTEFGWKHIEVVILGRSIVRLLEVKYKSSTELKEIYGRGSEPLGILEGNSKYEGELKIGQSELEALIRTAKTSTKTGKLSSLRFDIAISYSLDGTIVRDICYGARIKDFEKALKQGDTDMEVALPFMCVSINYNV